jgi:hypothetical protein
MTQLARNTVKPMIDTIGQIWKKFNWWIDTIGGQPDR